MAYLQLPVRSDIPSYDFQQDFEGTTFDLEFNYNTRGGYWMMDINDEDKNPILVGIRVVTEFPLLAYARVDGCPLGDFVAYDTTNQGQDATMSNFGDQIVLLYRESTTVDE